MPPRIADIFLECAVFLYPDDASARSSQDLGGSGFLIGKPFLASGEGQSGLWVVSNRHVVEKGGLTIRVNTHDGGFDTIDTTERDWFYHPDGDDLAVCPFFHRRPAHKFSHMPLDLLLTERTLSDYAIGPGDPAYVVGRFVNHEGRQQNTPTVRFGQIAQMPIEKLVYAGQEQESFLVEIRSIGGYSGSPVFVYLDRSYYRPIETGKTEDGKTFARGVFETGPWVLGVDWCMLPLWEPVCDDKGQELRNGWMVPGNTGMMGVIPAWRLRWLLTEHEPVVKRAQELEDRHLARGAAKSQGVILTSAKPEPPTTDENPDHREDFSRLLDAAVPGNKSDRQT